MMSDGDGRGDDGGDDDGNDPDDRQPFWCMVLMQPAETVTFLRTLVHSW